MKFNLSERTRGHKDDVVRTIQNYIKDGKVLRFNKVGFKTKYYGNDGGGLGKLNDRMEVSRIAVEELSMKYPKYGKAMVRKNGLHEFKLKLT